LPIPGRDRPSAHRAHRGLSRLARAGRLRWRAPPTCVTIIASEREDTMPRWLIAVLLGLAGSTAMAQTTPIVLRDMGSFHVGGRVVEITGKPTRELALPGGGTQKIDPNGRYLVEQMYVQYFLPQSRRGKVPLLMWHGGGLTGVTYETTPDGREGWLNLFVRKGFDVYVSDAVERGRAGWASPDRFAGE